MASLHCQICECIKSLIVDRISASANSDPYMTQNEVRVEDFSETSLPSFGIIVSPYAEEELVGTTSRDDIRYSVLITRIVSALNNDDKERRLQFREDLRLLFHRKRLTCIPTCHLYASINFGQVAIPKAWSQNNNSVSITKVDLIARLERE